MATRTKKILIGCSIGCGGLILLVVITIIGFVTWLNTPGELLEPGRLLGEDTTGYAEWTLSLDDPGTEEFVEGLLDKQEQAQQDMPEIFPPAIQTALQNWNSRRNRQNLRQMFPMVAAWTLTPAEEPDRDRTLVSVSIRALGNKLVFADWIMSLVGGDDPDYQKIHHLDEIIYRLGRDTDLTIFLRDSHIFFTYDIDTARAAVERLQPEQKAARQPGRLDALFAYAPEDQPLRAALTNERGEVLRIWQRVALPPDDPERLEESASRLRGVVLSGTLRGGETFEGELALQAPDRDWAAQYAEEALRDFQAGLAYEGFQLDSSVDTDGDWIRIHFRAEGLLDLASRLLNVQVTDRGGVTIITNDDGSPERPE